MSWREMERRGDGEKMERDYAELQYNMGNDV